MSFCHLDQNMSGLNDDHLTLSAFSYAQPALDALSKYVCYSQTFSKQSPARHQTMGYVKMPLLYMGD